jgi:ribosomal protein S14
MCKKIKWLERDKIIRRKFLKHEIRKMILKSLICSSSFNKKLYFDKKFKQIPWNWSISKARTSCMILGNSRGMIKKLKLSRHSAKKYANLGNIIGLRKSSF